QDKAQRGTWWVVIEIEATARVSCRTSTCDGRGARAMKSGKPTCNTIRKARYRTRRSDVGGLRCGLLECGVIIFGARYGGGYEGALWLAWCGDLEWLDDAQAGDTECMWFWKDYESAP